MSSKKEFTIRPFEKLRKSLKQQRAAAAPQPPRQKKKEDYTDDELFSREMDDVQEIETFRLLNCEPVRRMRSSGQLRSEPDCVSLAILGEIAAGQRPIHLPDTQEYIQWVSPRYHDTIAQKLHEGLFSTQAFLDIHGVTLAELDEELDLFLEESFRKGFRCLKIIPGRGLRSAKGPAIKDAVVRRLSGHHRRNIISFVSARQCDGGLGALYVLLGKR